MNDFLHRSNCSPIAYSKSFADHIGVPPEILNAIAQDVNLHWRPGRRMVKKSGEIRVTNSASPELKDIHRRINGTILRGVHYPDFLFGGLPKTLERGVRDHVANAKYHAGRRLIISTDIRGYFPSVTEPIIYGIWQGFFPFSPEVAKFVTSLTCHKGSLPQGWACSSYLAQLVFWDIESDIVSDLEKIGVRYSRLTDDITLSTNNTLTRRELTALISQVSGMLARKGTTLHRPKTNVASRSRRQTINKINVSVRGVTLAREYRKSLRSRVHRLITKPESFGDGLKREIQSTSSQINYLAKFHGVEAKRLKEQVKQLERSIGVA